jgi:hypothetical protein
MQRKRDGHATATRESAECGDDERTHYWTVLLKTIVPAPVSRPEIVAGRWGLRP